ncbi:MAG: hypothetical protein EOP06_24190, partial [Proteobacteria bacterium]
MQRGLQTAAEMFRWGLTLNGDLSMKHFIFAIVFLFTIISKAEVKTEVVDYKQGSTALQGFVAYDTAAKGKRPVIIIVHDWMGMTDNVKNRAKEFAAKGYVAIAADIYGKDAQPKDQKE